MMKIYFIGDTHFGRKYSYLQDHELNISKRNLDVITNCEMIITDAIANKADYVIFLGDVYDRKIISPTIRKIVRKRIFNPLSKANIPVLIIGGNHDNFRSPKRGVDLEDLSSYPNVEIVTSFKGKIITSNGKKIGLVCLPFIHYDILVSMAKAKNFPIPDEANSLVTAQTIVKTYITQICNGILKDCDSRILIGHYYVKGSKFRETSNPAQIFGEFQVNEEMIQKQFFDLVMFGHVHLHQKLYNDERIVILGSTDRIHMGERDTKKYYAIYEPENDKLDLKDIPCRNLIKKEIIAPKSTKDVTGYVVNNLPSKNDVKDAVCDINVKYTRGKSIHINKELIEQHFSDSFYSKITYMAQSEEDLLHLREANLSPPSLFQDYVKQKYHQHELFEGLKEAGSELIDTELKSTEITEKGALSIRSIDIQNFNKYGKGPNKVIFDKDHYVVKGPTGTGKSSLLDAITFALFKRNSRTDEKLTIDEILHEDGYVEVELMVGVNKLRVKRKKKSPKLEIFLNGKKPYQGLKIVEQEKKLEEIIGYDYDGFISSFFIRQQELQIFSLLSSSERQQRLAKLFKLKIFQSMDQILRKRIDKIKEDHDILRGSINTTQKRVETLSELQNDLKNFQNMFKLLSNQIAKQKDTIKTKRKSLEDAKTKITQFESVSGKIGEFEASIQKHQTEIRQLTQKQSNFETIKNQLKNFKDVNQYIKNAQNDRNVFVKMRSEKKLLESDIKNLKTNISRTEKGFKDQIQKIRFKVNEKQNRIKSISPELHKEEAFLILKNVGMLNERLSRLEKIEIPMAKEYIDDQKVLQFEDSIKKTKLQIEKIEPQQTKVTKDVFIADEILEDILALEQEITHLSQKKEVDLKPMVKNLESLHKSLKEKKLNENFNQKIQNIDKKLYTLEQNQNRKAKLEKSLGKLQDYAPLINRIKENLTQDSINLDKNRSEFKKLKPIYDKYQVNTKNIEKNEEELLDFEKNKVRLEVAIQQSEKDIAEIQRLKKTMRVDKKSLKALKDKFEIHTILRKDVFHLDGIPKFALEKILPAISIRASQILAELTNGRLNQIEFVPLQNRRVGFDILVFDGVSKREASTYSGGEKTQINAAIRFSIMEQIDEIQDTTGTIFRKSKTLFIDEGDLGTLDDESSRQLFVDKIMEMKKRFETIILITHLEDVAEQFPNTIKIGRDSNGYSKILS